MDRDRKQKSLTTYKCGDSFTFEDDTWVVTEYGLSPNDSGYDERQWTVQDKRSGETAYLLLCEETGNTTEKWVFTRQIVLGSVFISDDSPDQGRSLKEKMPGKPPQKMTYNMRDFFFKESYTTQAEDDDGNRVPKETWDYFDASELNNLAIEIWKEPDADYPEAFLGAIIPSSMFVYAGAKRVIAKKALGSLWIVPVSMFFLLCSGVPGDWLLALMLPIEALIWTLLLSPVCLLAVLAVTGVICALLFTVLFNTPAVFIGPIMVGLVTAFVRFGASMQEDIALNIPLVSGAAAFVPIVVFSFTIYFKFSPGPHSAGQLGATILLPVMIGAITALVNWGLGKLWPNTASNA